jgi:hypothetical protein
MQQVPSYRIGDVNALAIETGEFRGRGIRRVDIWIAKKWLTCNDNSAYLPTFCPDVEDAIWWLYSDPQLELPFSGLSVTENHIRVRAERGKSRERHRFFNWGPTTDNVICFLFRHLASLHLTFEFWRDNHHDSTDMGRVFTVAITERELLRTLHGTARELRRTGWMPTDI